MTDPRDPDKPTGPAPDNQTGPAPDEAPDATTPMARSPRGSDETQSIDTPAEESAVPQSRQAAGDIPPDHAPPPGWVPSAAAPADSDRRSFRDRAKGVAKHRAVPVVAALLVGGVLGSGITALVTTGHDGGRGDHTSQMRGDDRHGPGGGRDQGGPGNGGPSIDGPGNGGPGNGGPGNDQDSDDGPVGDAENGD